ncbi:MAG: TatD family hydrolase, partial [Desulfosalsimonas sp.]
MNLPRIIDTHTHLCDKSFDADRNEVIRRAGEAGVERMITVSETISDARRNLELTGQYPELLAAAGLYPAYTDLAAAEEMRKFIRQNRDRIAAIGEVGLDYRVIEDPDSRQIQRK